MKKNLLILIILFVSTLTYSQQRYVVIKSLNFRYDSSLDSEIIEVLNYKDTLEVLNDESDWSLVKYNGTIGYVWTNYTATEYDMIEYYEETVLMYVICNDSTIQHKISSKNCLYRGGVKKKVYNTNVYKNGEKLFTIDN